MWSKLDNGRLTSRRSTTYVNDAPNSVISKLKIYRTLASCYEIEVWSANGTYQAFIDAGFPAPEKGDDRMRVTTQFSNTVCHLLSVIQKQERDFIFIKQEVISLLGLQRLKPREPLPAWNKYLSVWNEQGYFIKGNNRRVCYANWLPDALALTLSIERSEVGDYDISVEVASVEAYNRLEQTMIKAGFFELRPVAGCQKSSFNLTTQSPDVTRHFLSAIKQLESSLSLIEAEIVSLLNLEQLEPIEPLPAWFQCGCLQKERSLRASVADGYHWVSYVASGSHNSPVRQCSVGSNFKDSFQFRFDLDRNDKALESKLKVQKSALKLYFLEASSCILVQQSFSKEDHSHFNELLALISQHCTIFSEVGEQCKQQVCSVIDSVSTLSPLSAPSQTIFSKQKTNEVTNKKAISDLNQQSMGEMPQSNLEYINKRPRL